MNRGDLVYTNQLAVGDRFYYLNDKKKIAWQVKSQEKKKAGSFGGPFMWLHTIIWQPELNDATKHIRIHKVVFLRSTIKQTESA
jgi:hypothetical protein